MEQPIANELLLRGALWRSAQHYLHEFANLQLARRPVAGIVLARIDAAADIARDEASCDKALATGAALVIEALEYELARPGLAHDETAVLRCLCDACTAAHAADPFGELFDAVKRRAEALYDEDWPSVVFSTRRFASPAGIYGVSSCTIPAASAPGAPVEVVLRVDPSAFGPESYAAIPALLIHECVCHVPTWRPGKPDNGSPFAEGFMDVAADYYRALWSAQLGALGPLVGPHGQRLFAEIEARGGDLGVGRSRGRYRAEVMKQQLERHHRAEMGDDAWRRVARLAIELNVAPRPVAVKDRFVNRLARDTAAPVERLLLSALRNLIPAAELL